MVNSVSSGNSRSRRQSSIVHDEFQNCECEVPCKLQVSWTERNPGRRFFGCGRYDGSTNHCGFFEWYDPPVGRFSATIVNRLLKNNESLLEEVKAGKENVMALQLNLEKEKADNKVLAGKVASYEAEVKKPKLVIVCILFILVGSWIQMWGR